MTNKEAIEIWAEKIIPAVFRAEEAMLKGNPEWQERLKNLTPENGQQVASEYCHEIARIIVVHASDYKPDGTIPDEESHDL